MTSPILAAGLLLGYAADLVLGDPVRGHPVAVFGRYALVLEGRLHDDDVRAGAAHTVAALAPPVLVAAALDGACRRAPAGRLLLVGATTWAALGGRSLGLEGRAMADLLAADDLAGARRRLGHLCARDARDLDAAELARATVESLAENSSDAVVAPLFWGAVAGPAGIVAYRCLNTLDAMVGYTSPRYLRFGRVAARTDDAANVLPSRLAAALTVVLAPIVGGRPREAWRAWRRDAGAHPSPNAGPVEASAAGALGVRLGGSNSYGDVREDRGVLGDGRPVEVGDIDRALRLSGAVGAAALAACTLLASVRKDG